MDSSRTRRIAAYAAVAVGTAVATAVVAALLVNIFQRKQEARQPFVRLTEVTEDDDGAPHR